jgi:hypothetical protein
LTNYRVIVLAAVLTATAGLSVDAQIPVKRFEPVSFSQVDITDQFWRPKLDKVATATLQACIFQTEEKTGRIRNFEKVSVGNTRNTKEFITMIAMFTRPSKPLLIR